MIVVVCSSKSDPFRTPFQRTGDQNVAIVISTSIYNKLDGVGNVGSIVGVYHHSAHGTVYISTIGTAISGSFLFIVGLANSVILYRILRQRRQVCPPHAHIFDLHTYHPTDRPDVNEVRSTERQIQRLPRIRTC